jgi:hypothetical protein
MASSRSSNLFFLDFGALLLFLFLFWARFLKILERMDITQWYAVFLGAFIVLPMTTWIARCISGLVQEHQHVLHKYVSISRRITRLEAFLILAILVGNAVCIGVNVHSAQTLMYRSGLLSSINFAFLSFGCQMSYIYKSSVTRYIRIHYWAAGISITEALVHSVIAVILRTWRTDIISQITTWTVCLASSAPTAI